MNVEPHVYLVLFLAAFQKLQKATVSVFLSLCPDEATRIALNEFS
jgi:hypothetical protein